MSASRYSNTNRLSYGTVVGTCTACSTIYNAVINNQVSYTQRILREGERLDTLAGSLYGDANYWWVIAAASGIGWGLQVPPDTIIIVPSLSDVLKIL